MGAFGRHLGSLGDGGAAHARVCGCFGSSWVCPCHCPMLACAGRPQCWLMVAAAQGCTPWWAEALAWRAANTPHAGARPAQPGPHLAALLLQRFYHRRAPLVNGIGHLFTSTLACTVQLRLSQQTLQPQRLADFLALQCAQGLSIGLCQRSCMAAQQRCPRKSYALHLLQTLWRDSPPEEPKTVHGSTHDHVANYELKKRTGPGSILS